MNFFELRENPGYSVLFAILFEIKLENIFHNVELKRLTCSFICNLIKTPCQLNWLMALFIVLTLAFAWFQTWRL